LEFIECEKIQGVGYCSDNECSCTLTQLSSGGGYIYISPEVAEFRKDALSLVEVKIKLEQQSQAGEYISVSKYAPILVCEIAAQKRNLDMAIAKADAQMFWREGRVPLRATPWAKADDPLSLSNMFSSIPGDDNPFMNIESKQEKNVPAPEIPAEKSEPKITEPTVPVDRQQPPAQPLSDASVADVVAQYSSGPLAELAKKMEQGMGGAAGNTASFQNPLPETVVTSGPKLKQIVRDEDYDDQDYYNAGNKKPKKEKNSLKSNQKSASSVVLTVLAVVLAVAAIGVLTAVVIVKFQPVKTQKAQKIEKIEKIDKIDKAEKIETVEKVPVVDPEPPVQEVKRNEIDKTFFEKSYAFEDANCKGTISFVISDDSSGRYTQLVHLKVNEEKTYTVHGGFTYTPKTIVFRPDTYKKDIQWVVDQCDPQGSAVFHDPSKQDIEKARVYLKVSTPQGN
jgi:hypothetical protein